MYTLRNFAHSLCTFFKVPFKFCSPTGMRRVVGSLLFVSQLAYARATVAFPDTAMKPAPVQWASSSPLELCRGPDCPAPKLKGLLPLPWWSLLSPSWDTLLHQSSLEPDVVPVPMRGCTAQVGFRMSRIFRNASLFPPGMPVQGPQVESWRVSS